MLRTRNWDLKPYHFSYAFVYRLFCYGIEIQYKLIRIVCIFSSIRTKKTSTACRVMLGNLT